MNQPLHSQEPNPLSAGLASIAADLQNLSDKVRRLAEELQVREKVHQEALANYDSLEKIVLRLWAELDERDNPFPDNLDLETYAREQGAMPFETFMAELGLLEERP